MSLILGTICPESQKNATAHIGQQWLNCPISQLPNQKINAAKAAKAATDFSGPVVILTARACP
jgi:hypothetical protein